MVIGGEEGQECQSVTLSIVPTLSDISTKPSENYILVPTSFTLNILRNLSSSWYKERPDMEVSGKIHAINVSGGL